MNPAQTFKEKLQERHIAAKRSFAQAHPHANAILDNAGVGLSAIRQHSAKAIAGAAISGTLLLSPGHAYAQSLPLPAPVAQALTSGVASSTLNTEQFSSQLQKILPPIHNALALPFLAPGEEKILGKVIEQGTGVKAVATLEGEHLNTVYGNIGAEQHLRRFPGDTIAQHGEFANVEGMAPGNGGFGYFIGADGKLSQEEVDREKYYVAVQLMYLPDWNKRLRYLVDWYKWRKVIVVNPDNGRGVVAVVGDAGPAAWTGKHFGGSPEVMDWLGGNRYKKGRVLLYFVDDPNNVVPLGPVNNEKGKLKTTEEFLKGPA